MFEFCFASLHNIDLNTFSKKAAGLVCENLSEGKDKHKKESKSLKSGKKCLKLCLLLIGLLKSQDFVLDW